MPPINSRDYWNMGGQVRQGKQKGGATKQEQFEELRSALQEAGFHVRSRIHTDFNTESGRLIIFYSNIRAVIGFYRRRYSSLFKLSTGLPNGRILGS